MQYCEKCKVDIRGPEEICPLCQGKLTKSSLVNEDLGEQAVYPAVKKARRKFWIFFRILTMICVSGSVVAVMLDLMMPKAESWTFFVLVGILCLWLALNLAIYKRHIIVKNITWEAVLLIGMCMAWDLITGSKGWSVDFVLPIGFTAATLSVWIIAIVKKLPAGDYLICLLTMDILGILPLLLYYLGKVTIIYPSLICSGASIIFLCFLLFFEGPNLKREMEKRLHL